MLVKPFTHTERTPEELKGKTYQMEGYQIWLALPKDMEDNEPEFHHLKAHDIPSWEENNLVLKLIVGNAFGKKSNLTLWSDLFMLEIVAKKDTTVNLTDNLKGEIGILVHSGENYSM